MQSSKAASGNKCNWLYGPHCILPAGHGEKLLHRLAPYQAVQRKKSLDSKGLAGHCEGLLAGSGGQDRKSDDAASLNPAASAGLGRGSKLYNCLSFPSATTQVPRPLFSLVSAHLQLFANHVSCWSACLWCVLAWWIIYCSQCYLCPGFTHSSKCCSFLACGCSDPILFQPVQNTVTIYFYLALFPACLAFQVPAQENWAAGGTAFSAALWQPAAIGTCRLVNIYSGLRGLWLTRE